MRDVAKVWDKPPFIPPPLVDGSPLPTNKRKRLEVDACTETLSAGEKDKAAAQPHEDASLVETLDVSRASAECPRAEAVPSKSPSAELRFPAVLCADAALILQEQDDILLSPAAVTPGSTDIHPGQVEVIPFEEEIGDENADDYLVVTYDGPQLEPRFEKGGKPIELYDLSLVAPGSVPADPRDCWICHTDRACVLVVGCGHTCMCGPCAFAYSRAGKNVRCPMCRAIVRDPAGNPMFQVVR